MNNSSDQPNAEDVWVFVNVQVEPYKLQTRPNASDAVNVSKYVR